MTPETPGPNDVPSTVDQFLFRPLPHALAATGLLSAGLFLGSPLLGLGAVATVIGSNFFLANRLARYLRSGQLRRFLVLAEQVEATFPIPYRPILNLPELRAVAYAHLGEVERAKQIFAGVKARGLKPGSEILFANNLASLFYTIQDPGSALEVLDTVDVRRPGTRVLHAQHSLLTRVYVLLSMGNYTAAAETLQTLKQLEEIPPAFQASILACQSVLELELDRDLPKAVATARQSLAAVPTGTRDDDARLVLAYALLESREDPASVLDLLAPLAELESSCSPPAKSWLHYLLSRCHHLMGSTEFAQKHLEEGKRHTGPGRLADKVAALESQMSGAPEA